MSWLLMARHHIAHIEPTYGSAGSPTTGSAVAGYALGNVRTLTLDARAAISPSGGVIEIRWDRGSGTLAAVNSLAIIGHNLFDGGYDIDADSSSSATFAAGNTALVNANTPATNADRFFTFSDTTQRYLRVVFSTGSGNAYIGCVSFGYAYTLEPVMPESWGGSGGGGGGTSPLGIPRITGMTYGTGSHGFNTRASMARADALALWNDWRRTWIPGSVGIYDAVGCASGGTPMILSDTSDNDPDNVYMGRGSVSIIGSTGPPYCGVNVQFSELMNPVGLVS